jgi:Cyclic GMP-AMP synthase DncV-like, nucleotidyltransferase domain
LTVINKRLQSDALQLLADQLDIPRSVYEKAEKRYRSLGEWLERPESALSGLRPTVYPQGSFRYGTVIWSDHECDLDLVCELLALEKADQSQRAVKEMVGVEIIAYARAHSMKQEPKPTRRCWHLDYADEGINFHIDSLPAVPEDDDVKAAIAAEIQRTLGNPQLAQFAIAITDEKHRGYDSLDRNWPMSNPRGFARWFEARMRLAAERILKARARKIEDVPAYDWKTPLQIAIQILKQHRDNMFARDPKRKPISMIITTLAALAYEGQLDLRETLQAFVDRVPTLVDRHRAVILNPVNPGENFADKWAEKPELADAFWVWFDELSRDIARFGERLTATELQRHFRDRFGLSIPYDKVESLIPALTVPAVATRHVEHRAEPWGTND